MKILISPDKFKGSLTAEEVTDAIAIGISSFSQAHEIIPFPLADGGDGTAMILTRHLNGKIIHITVNDPLLREITSWYGLSGDGKTAFIEMSAASGLRLLEDNERNCMETSTYGTGELILHAVNRGAERIILGIGGSATNDAGIGMSAALGYRFLDKDQNVLKPIGKNLSLIESIDDSSLLINVEKLDVLVASDVENPLYGPDGAAFVYSPQKGATPQQVEDLDHGLRHFSSVIKRQYSLDISQVPGGGAAGGLGAGTMLFLKASLKSGIDLVMEITGFEKQLMHADLVITGEGRIDEQSFQGKVIDGVCKLSKPKNIPVLAVCGQLNLDQNTLRSFGIRFCFSLEKLYGSVDMAMKSASEGITELTKKMLSKMHEEG